MGKILLLKDLVLVSPSEYNLLIGKLKKDVKEDEIFNKKHF